MQFLVLLDQELLKFLVVHQLLPSILFLVVVLLADGVEVVPEDIGLVILN